VGVTAHLKWWQPKIIPRGVYCSEISKREKEGKKINK
jgi:hypothetical protein